MTHNHLVPGSSPGGTTLKAILLEGLFVYIRPLFKKMIKKYLGIVGFLISFVGITISAYYKFYGMDIEPLGEISFFVWITTWTISSEINKEKPRKWWVYTVLILSLVAISAMFFVF